MIRLYTEGNISKDTRILLAPDQVHYLFHVMRCRDGDEISLFNASSGEWICRICRLTKKEALVLPVNRFRAPEIRSSCVLCPALIKKERMDMVIEKAVELGVTQIRPVLTQRTVVRGFNRERAQIIAKEAAEQCERLDVPLIFDPVSLPGLLALCPDDAQLVYLSERTGGAGNVDEQKTPWFLIGPEGGFSSEEKQMIEAVPGCLRVHLGTTILRAETAALAVLACWQFRCFLPGRKTI